LREVFPLCAEIKTPVPGPGAFKNIDGDKVRFATPILPGCLFQNKVFFPKYNVKRKRY